MSTDKNRSQAGRTTPAESPCQSDRPWELTGQSMGQLRGHDYAVAVLPIGATEPHNTHLPYGTDFIHASYIANHCCRYAWEHDVNALSCPPVPYGVDCNLMAFPMAMHISQDTLNQLCRDLIGSLVHHGIRKILILNGHGGNDFGPLVRELQPGIDGFLGVCNWWTVGNDQYDTIFEHPDDHAGELETSVMLAIAERVKGSTDSPGCSFGGQPELSTTAMSPGTAGPGKTPPFRFEALREGWVRSSRDFATMNDHCAAGNPSAATAEKGRQYLELVCRRIGDFLVDLGRADIDDAFPFNPLNIP